MKKTIILLLAVALICCSFVACSKAENGVETTTFPSTTQPTTNAISTTAPTGRIYYDKKGLEHESLETMPFYDENDFKYYLKDQVNQIFVDESGIEVDGLKCYVDSYGTFIYDKYDQITLNDDIMSATGKDGKTYYPAATVRWTVDGVMVGSFGFGDDIIPE